MGREALLPIHRSNAHKIGGLEARPAHQRPVHILDGHEFGSVRGLDRPAIENADLGPLILADDLFEIGADRGMDLRHIGRRRGQPGADRPDRLIGHNKVSGIHPVRDRALELLADDRERLPGFTLGLGFPNANNRRQGRPAGGLRLGADDGIRLLMVGPALGMADNDVGTTRIGDHFRRNIACMGARDMGMAILPPGQKARSGRLAAEGRDQGRGRANQEVDGPAQRPIIFSDHGASLVQAAAHAIHFPIARNQRPNARCHEEPPSLNLPSA